MVSLSKARDVGRGCGFRVGTCTSPQKAEHTHANLMPARKSPLRAVAWQRTSFTKHWSNGVEASSGTEVGPCERRDGRRSGGGGKYSERLGSAFDRGGSNFADQHTVVFLRAGLPSRGASDLTNVAGSDESVR